MKVSRNNPRHWTREDEQYLVKRYGELKETKHWYYQVGRELNRSGGSVQCRLKEIRDRGRQ